MTPSQFRGCYFARCGHPLTVMSRLSRCVCSVYTMATLPMVPGPLGSGVATQGVTEQWHFAGAHFGMCKKHGLLTQRHNAAQRAVSATLRAVGVESKVQEVRLNEKPALKGDAFCRAWGYMFQFQEHGMRSIVEDTTVYSSYELGRIKHAARTDNFAIKLAIATKIKAKKQYCDNKNWDFWVHAFNTQGGIDNQSYIALTGAFEAKLANGDATEWEIIHEKQRHYEAISSAVVLGCWTMVDSLATDLASHSAPPAPEIDEHARG